MVRSYLFIATTVFAVMVVFGAPAAAVAPAHSIQTGADLAEVCSTPADSGNISDGERQRLNVCGAYIQGFLGHYAVARRNMSKPDFCLPAEGIAADRVRLLLLALLEQRPQIRDLPANLNLATSLAWGYSCNGRTSQ